MIRSRAGLLTYLAADEVAMERYGRSRTPCREVMRFLRRLRLTEYWTNRRAGIWSEAIRAFHAWRLHRQSLRCGFSIPPNVFGPGLTIPARGYIVVHPGVRVGARCTLHVDVTIGPAPGTDAAPVLGDNCRVGPGARLTGAIAIGDHSTIAANAVVVQSFPRGHVTVAGAPAREVRDGDAAHLAFRLERAAFPLA
jgi:serine O-acetyltransferase